MASTRCWFDVDVGPASTTSQYQINIWQIYDVRWMLEHRRRWWPSIITALIKRLRFAGYFPQGKTFAHLYLYVIVIYFILLYFLLIFWTSLNYFTCTAKRKSRLFRSENLYISEDITQCSIYWRISLWFPSLLHRVKHWRWFQVMLNVIQTHIKKAWNIECYKTTGDQWNIDPFHTLESSMTRSPVIDMENLSIFCKSP